MKSLCLTVFLCLLAAPYALAEAESDELKALRSQVDQLTGAVRELTATVQAQQQRLDALEIEKQSASAKVDAQPTAPAVSAIPAKSRSTGTSLSALNPEIGVNADFVGQLSESSQDGEGNDKLSAREVELVFGHPIDPYSRLDVTVAFSDFEEVELEEAFITHWGLPADLRARVGRMRPKIGKASVLHRDQLDTVDEPLVVDRYLGEEGLFRTGADVSAFLPVPWEAVTHELTAGILEGGVGEGATLFGTSRRRPTLYTHLKNFWDPTDETSAELGLTYLTGSSDADASFEVHAVGVDATVKHFVTPSNPLKWQSEIFIQDRDETTNALNHPWGAYSLLDYRLNQQWAVGGRLDYVEPTDLFAASQARDADTAFGGYLTFYQSEWARWRMQYRHTDFAAGGDDDSFFVQGTVSIGVHKHALQ